MDIYLPFKPKPPRAAIPITNKMVFFGAATRPVTVWSGAGVIVTLVDLEEDGNTHYSFIN